mgnify:CR=1 FL=1
MPPGDVILFRIEHDAALLSRHLAQAFTQHIIELAQDVISVVAGLFGGCVHAGQYPHARGEQ